MLLLDISTKCGEKTVDEDKKGLCATDRNDLLSGNADGSIGWPGLHK